MTEDLLRNKDNKYDKFFDQFQTITKVWGNEHILVNNESYACKRLVIFPEHHVSLHSHINKDETFIFAGTEVIIFVQDTLYKITSGIVRVRPMQLHSFFSLYGGVLLEVSTHDSASDTVRKFESGRCEYTEWLSKLSKANGKIPLQSWQSTRKSS